MEGCPLPAYGAAPGRDNGAAAVQAAHRRLLRVQKRRRPPAVQDLLEQGPLPLLDEQIHVQKLVAQQLGQQDTCGAFAGTRHADKGDVIQNRFQPLHTNLFYSIPQTKEKEKGEKQGGSEIEGLCPCKTERFGV